MSNIIHPLTQVMCMIVFESFTEKVMWVTTKQQQGKQNCQADKLTRNRLVSWNLELHFFKFVVVVVIVVSTAAAASATTAATWTAAAVCYRVWF